MSFDLIIFIFYVLILISLGWYKTNSIKSETSYLLANRSTKLFPLVATLVMTEFNTSTLIGFSSVGFSVGAWGMLLPSVFLFGIGFYAFSVAKKWKEFNGLSTAGFFTKLYGPFLGKTASVCLILAMLGFSATYVKSLILIFQPIVPQMSEWLLGLGFVLLVLIFSLNGGLISIVRTDIFGFISVLIFIPALLYFSWEYSGRDSLALFQKFPLQESSQKLPLSFIGSLVVLTMFTYISAPWYSQKIFSAKNESTAFQAVGISAILVFLLYGFPVLATGFFAIASPTSLNAQLAIPELINLSFPLGWKGFAYGVLLMAGATTLAGVWSAMTTMVVGDFLGEPSQDKNRSRLITIFFATGSWILGIVLVDNVLNKLILANIPIAALSFALLGGFYWKGISKSGVYISILVGLFWGIFCFFYWGETGGYTLYWAFAGIPLIFASGIVVSLFTKSPR
jgi:SSS family solute:Na+ symporter